MHQFLQGQVDIIRQVSTEAVDLFGKRPYEELTWRASPDKWNIAQILDHIIVSDRTYFDQFDEVADGLHKNTFYQNLWFISDFWGKQMIKTLGPDRVKTFKSPPLFKPSDGIIRDTIVTDFKNHQKQMRGYFERLDGVLLETTVISSPVSNFITYNLRDALQILTGHQLRHLEQAKEVLAHPNFGKWR